MHSQVVGVSKPICRCLELTCAVRTRGCIGVYVKGAMIIGRMRRVTMSGGSMLISVHGLVKRMLHLCGCADRRMV